MIWITSTFEGSGLITQEIFVPVCVIINYELDLSLRWGRSYYESINVCNISLSIDVYFCASATLGIFMGF